MYEFSERLRSLRKENKLSQKEVALDLEVSQALLSHYERGIRECGLEFLVKAAGYYGVSVDYLLGRTTSKNGSLCLVDDGSFNEVLSAMQIILDQISEMNDQQVSEAVLRLFEIEISKLVNMISAFSNTRSDIFGAEYGVTSTLLGCAESRLKSKLLLALRDAASTAPDFTKSTITKKYPNTYQALLNITAKGETTSMAFLDNVLKN